jgi:hypothetical protein
VATKNEELELLALGKGCLGKADLNEPIFILRGQDMLAADLVDQWAIRARSWGCPEEKVQEAKELANAMRRWTPRKYPD